jgi:hypothetical protein
MPTQERFMKFIKINPTTSCWEWQGAKHEYGYGLFEFKSANGRWRSICAHRIAWIIFKGPIPDKLHIRHKCDNPPCVNPDHLEIGTHKDNMRDRHERKTHPFSALTHCKNGHEFTTENTYLWRRSDTNIIRKCRTCRRESMMR